MFLFPIKGYYHKTQGFGERGINYDGLIPSGRHDGIDYAAKRGAPIVAPDDGQVKRLYKDAKPDVGGYGNFVRLWTSAGKQGLFFDHVLGHLLSVVVQEGQQVKRGDLLGFVDSTGYSTGDHLHWGVRYYEITPERADIKDYANGFYGYFDFENLLDGGVEKYPVDDYYGQKPNAWRERTWKVVNEKYAKKKAFFAGVPYDERIMKAFVYGCWDVQTVYNSALVPLWREYSKPAWNKFKNNL